MNISIRQIGTADAAVVQRIYERSPSYFVKVEGSAVLPHFAFRDLNDSPKTIVPAYSKYFCLAEADGEAVGVIDLHLNHPSDKLVYIGLLLILDELHGQGVGTKVFQSVEKLIGEKWGMKTMRLGVSEKNNVEPFWLKMGFQRNGHTYTWKGENISTQVFEMEKKVSVRK